MSIIGRKPFVETIISSCNSTQAKSVSTLLNNLGSFITVSLFNTSDTLGANYEISGSLKTEVKHVHFMLDKNKIIDGILVYLSDSKCALFGFNDDTGIVTEFDINPVAKTYNQINEHCTAEELRQVVGDKLIEVGDGDFVSEEELKAAIEGKANVLTIDYDFDSLPSSFVEQLQLGDLIYSGAQDHLAICVAKGDDEYIQIIDISDMNEYVYLYNEDTSEYEFDHISEPSFGTKLYRHSFSVPFAGPSVNVIVISNSSTPITGAELYDPTGQTPFILDSSKVINYFCENAVYILSSASTGGGYALKIVKAGDESTTYTLNSEPTITDTVTEL